VTRFRVAAALALAALCACGGSAPDAPRRVVLVTIDTLRADHVGCYGAAGADTPTLDRLAAEGVRFETAISPAPLTLPSHTSLLTGLDPPRHGVHNNAYFRLPEAGPATLAERFRAGGFATAAFVASFVLDRRFGLDRGFDVFDDQMGLADVRSLAPPERNGDVVVDSALAWLARAPERFFLWVHLYDPHAPYAPPPPFDERFRHDPYAGEIAFADRQLGRLLAALEARFPDGASAVLVTSDHGESRGEHGELSHAYGVYEATQRVPLLLRAPGLPAGRTLAGLARLSDVAPTLLELAGLPPLAEATGGSLLALLAGADGPSAAYVETLATRFDMGWSALYGLRTRDRKYIRAPRPELYDLDADPRERNDLAAARPDEVAELDRALDALLADARPIAPNLTLDPGDRARLEALGYVARESAEPADAPGRVAGVDPKDGMRDFAVLLEVEPLVVAGRADEALARLAPFAALKSDWVQSLRATAALAAGRPDVAREAGELLVELKPFAPGGHLMLAAALEVEQRWDEAEAAYRGIHATHPEMGHASTGLGRVAEARGQREAAAERYGAALAARVPDVDAAWRLGALRLEDGDAAGASELLARVPPAILRTPPAALRLGYAERTAGRLDMALLRVDAGLRERPETVSLLELKGDLLEQQGDASGALRVREQALALQPDSPRLANQVAWNLLALGRGRLERALELATRAAEGLPREPEVLDTLAAVRLARGEPDAALAPLAVALERAEGDTRARLLLRRAEASARLGRRDEARRDLAAALGGRPVDELPGELGRLARRVRQLVEAPVAPATG
jgi:arylsulfatase A-like enzyme/Tfp pilus assembly protein PilF